MLLQELEVPEVHKRPCVYFLISENIVVYVGQSGCVPQRVGTHRVDKEFDRVLFFECDPEQINEIERRLIFELTPEYNNEWRERERTGPWPIEDKINSEIADRRISELLAEDDPSCHILDRPITALQLSRRVTRRLAFKNVLRISEIKELGLDGLLEIPGFGAGSMIEIREAMQAAGVEVY